MGSLQKVYNSLGDVYEGFETMASRPHVLFTLANLLIECRLDKTYDIRLNHKHFDIRDGEQVVSFTGRDLILSSVCNNGELPTEMLSAEGINPVQGGAIRPSDFLLKDGIAIPYEFAYTTSPPGRALNPYFLEQWCSILEREDMEGLLGLCVRDDNVPVNAHEVSDSEKRVNRLFFVDAREKGMDVISTTWRVREHGNKC
ncbi:uncharacterized protein FTOL_13514 [Fusarium torulosum]|uniref:Uncharacterized protein n=1 Tax=Fusarium torulosum TaxID=33205 RepID=A0AAE8SPZ7_9HYPO|nr:uncharacterized protein FTOL_13514 [Fusarium torulosum]